MDHNQAFAAVGKLGELLILAQQYSGKWRAKFKSAPTYTGIAETAPLAICRAVKAYIEAQQ